MKLSLVAAAVAMGLHLAEVEAFLATPGASALPGPGLACRGRAGLATSAAHSLRCAGTKYGESRVQIVTDIDDTVKSSGGVRALGNIGPALGGIDTQYKRGDFYPGVFQFGAEISNYGNPPNMQPAPVAVLTARARELKIFLALKPKTKLVMEYRKAAEKLFEGWGIGDPKWTVDCDNTVLYGSIAEWILQFRKGWRKFDNFKKLRELSDGRTRYLLVGDTGELDQQCGEWMAEDYPEEVAGLFFHVISEREWRTKPILLPADKKVNGVPVYFFRTYVGAARKAFREGLIGEDELVRVVRAAQAGLEGVPKDDLKWADLNKDIELAIISLGMKIKPQAPAGKPQAASVPAAEAPAKPPAEKKSWFASLLGR